MYSKMNDTTSIFKALSDINRLRILKMLQSKPLCVCEITEILQLAPSTVSQHLSILKKEGFINEVRDGKWINYIINIRPVDPRISSLLSTLDYWIGQNDVVIEDMKKVATVNRAIICTK